MMTEENITERLEAMGYKGAELRGTMRDVGKLIVARTAAEYISQLPQSEQEKLKSLSETEVETYLAEHRSSFPAMSQEAFEKIHDGTWEEFFSAVDQ
jgi:hypothetical protein